MGELMVRSSCVKTQGSLTHLHLFHCDSAQGEGGKTGKGGQNSVSEEQQQVRGRSRTEAKG